MKRTIVLAVLALACAMGGLFLWHAPVQAQSADDIVIIANKAFPANALSMAQVKRIFQKKMTNVRGKKVVPIHAKKNSKARKIFNQTVLGMSVSDEQSYWQAEMVRSGVRAPAEFSNTLRAVFSVKTSVGYCLQKDFNSEVAKQLVAFVRPYPAAKSTMLVRFGNPASSIRF